MDAKLGCGCTQEGSEQYALWIGDAVFHIVLPHHDAVIFRRCSKEPGTIDIDKVNKKLSGHIPYIGDTKMDAELNNDTIRRVTLAKNETPGQALERTVQEIRREQDLQEGESTLTAMEKAKYLKEIDDNADIETLLRAVKFLVTKHSMMPAPKRTEITITYTEKGWALSEHSRYYQEKEPTISSGSRSICKKCGGSIKPGELLKPNVWDHIHLECPK